MKEFFSLNPVWDEKQIEALNAKPDIIISGCAGSGKTLIAIHLAKRLYEESENPILILTYTIALSSFIRQTLRQLGTNDDVEVMHEAQFRRFERNRQLKNYEYIIIDEAQDFSVQDIDELQNLSSQGIYVFGDDKQQLYPKNFADVRNLNLKDLRYQLDLRSIQLKKNYRISQPITDFILDVHPNSFLSQNNSKSSSLQKPIIIRLPSPQEQLEWLKNYIVTNKEKIGILVERNESKGKEPNDKSWVPGIIDIVDYLSKTEVAIGYKYYSKVHSENIDKLNFDNENNVNVLTTYSSKGLQFDTVIIPFNDSNTAFYSETSLEDSREVKVQYVAMTRAKNKLYILYSKKLEPCFANCKDQNKYDGEIEVPPKMSFTEWIKKSRNDKEGSM